MVLTSFGATHVLIASHMGAPTQDWLAIMFATTVASLYRVNLETSLWRVNID